MSAETTEITETTETTEITETTETTETTNLKKIFTKDIITHFRLNKSEINDELLDELRKTKEGKKIAFDMLDIEKNDEGYYMDSFGHRISYMKIPTLKSINTKISLSPIHIEEIKKCKDDIYYFMKNYVKIKTPKGIDYPDLRYYQLEFLDCIIQDDHESIVGLLPRQCINKETMVNVNNKDQTVEDLFNECKQENV